MLKERYELFAHGLAAGKTAGDAYADAGFNAKGKVAVAAACRLLRLHPEIQARADELRARVAEDVTKAVVVNKAWLIAQAVEVLALAKASKQYAVAIRAIELLGREFKSFIDRKDITVRRLADLDESELQELLDEFEAGNPTSETSPGYTH